MIKAEWTNKDSLDLQQTCNKLATTEGDLISRVDAIKAVWNAYADAINIGDNGEEIASDIDIILSALPSAEPKTDDENELKFYYVESLDDYWVGRRIDNFYYATWHGRLGFIWSHSKYLPWGEHIVDENTLWKEHTYPSEPIEIPFTEWIVGFVKKYFKGPKTGEWVKIIDEETPNLTKWHYECDQCGAGRWEEGQRYCQNCGARMIREDGET